MATWDPTLYMKFAAERTRPSHDLANRIAVAGPRRVVDLGCGPGNSTAVLRGRWPDADLTGIDNDPAMLDAARLSDPVARWELGDVSTWGAGESWDVVFSNAVLQWVPDHAVVLPRLLAAVRAGGALAVQIPTHLYSPVHRHLLELAERPDWKPALAGATGAIVSHTPAFYYDLLAGGAVSIDLWETEYCHVMSGPDAILSWLRGTGLRPFLQALLTDDDRRRFEAEMLARIATDYPRRADGRVLFPFRRLFLIAYPPG